MKEIKNFLEEEEGGINKESILKTAVTVGSVAAVSVEGIEEVKAHDIYGVNVEKIDEDTGIKSDLEWLGCG